LVLLAHQAHRRLPLPIDGSFVHIRIAIVTARSLFAVENESGIGGTTDKLESTV
jgi:hypothetical protein